MLRVLACCLPAIIAGNERRNAAQDTKESAQHIPQHSNGAEPTEICPTCKGDGIARDGGYPYNGRCGLCGGSGKLRHC